MNRDSIIGIIDCTINTIDPFLNKNTLIHGRTVIREAMESMVEEILCEELKHCYTKGEVELLTKTIKENYEVQLEEYKYSNKILEDENNQLIADIAELKHTKDNLKIENRQLMDTLEQIQYDEGYQSIIEEQEEEINTLNDKIEMLRKLLDSFIDIYLWGEATHN